MNTTDRLRQAAQKIRDTAEAATPGPWTYNEPFPSGIYTAAPIDADGMNDARTFTGYRLQAREDPREWHGELAAWRDADIRHIAMWSPPLALLIADWLEDIAADKDSGLGSIHPRAIDVADLIIGGNQ